MEKPLLCDTAFLTLLNYLRQYVSVILLHVCNPFNKTNQSINT